MEKVRVSLIFTGLTPSIAKTDWPRADQPGLSKWLREHGQQLETDKVTSGIDDRSTFGQIRCRRLAKCAGIVRNQSGFLSRNP